MLKPAPLKRRFCSLLYDALLTAAITCVAFIPAGLVAWWLNPLAPRLALIAVSLIFIAIWWQYAKLNWHKKGRTLAMQTWQIGLANHADSQPTLSQIRLRFVWAIVFLVFIPMLAYAAFSQVLGIAPKAAFSMALSWWILPWGFAFLHPDKQFLYDLLAGTRLVDTRKNSK